MLGTCGFELEVLDQPHKSLLIGCRKASFHLFGIQAGCTLMIRVSDAKKIPLDQRGLELRPPDALANGEWLFQL